MNDIIARIDALLANTPPAEIEEFEVTRCLRDCRDEIIAARACAEMMLQGTGQRLAESMAERVINGQTVGAWIPVSERVPDRGQIVLASCSDVPPQSFTVAVCTYDKHLPENEYGFRTDWSEDIRPTHWMPLPSPPTDGN